MRSTCRRRLWLAGWGVLLGLLSGCGLFSGPRLVVVPKPRACPSPARKYEPPPPAGAASPPPAVQVSQPPTQPSGPR